MQDKITVNLDYVSEFCSLRTRTLDVVNWK